MSTEFLHGARAKNRNDGYIEARVPSMSTIGTVCTANDADTDFFPLNQCILVTNLKAAIAKAGKTGTLRETLLNIDSEVNTNVVVVRVEEDETDDQKTIANVIGKINDDDTRTGLRALELANDTGVTPRIFCLPKYDMNKSVALALGSHAHERYGFAYASASHMDNIAAALKYREEFAIDEMMLFYGDVIQFNETVGLPTETYSTAKVAGLRARLDQEFGFQYSISNHVLERVEGLTKPVTYEGINGYGTEANTLNEKGISCFIRDDGYRTWGNRTTAGADSDKYFECVMRTTQALTLTLANLMKNITQDKPMTAALLELFRVRADRVIQAWVRAGRLLGGHIILHPNKNSVDELMSGRPDWLAQVTPVPPTESPGLEVEITSEYVMNALGGL